MGSSVGLMCIKEKTVVEHEENTEVFRLGETVVSTMVDDLHDKHHQVYFDNYFSSVPVMEYLKTKGVDACGTIRSNRKFNYL